MNRFIDAEKALAELDRTPVVLKNFQGRDWELFASMPAKPVFELMLIEAGERSKDDLSRGEMLSMMSKMVPSEVFDGWLDGGVTMDEATVLLNRVIAAYRGEDGESAEGEASGPATGPTPTSSTSAQ